METSDSFPVAAVLLTAGSLILAAVVPLGFFAYVIHRKRKVQHRRFARQTIDTALLSTKRLGSWSLGYQPAACNPLTTTW